MKHLAFLILMLLSLGNSLSAQEQQATSEFNGWGVRASLDVTLPGKWKTANGESISMFSNGAGFAAGVVYNLPFAGNFYFEPGLTLFYDTYKYKDLVVAGDPNGEPISTDPSVKKFGVRVPLMVGYRFYPSDNFSFSLYTGPELSYGLSGKVGIDSDEDFGPDFSTNIYKMGYRRLDCAWKVGVGFPFGRWLMALEGAIGITDLHKNDVKFRENRFSLTVGYDF